MADNFIEMQKTNISPDGEQRIFAYEMELSLSSIGNTQWILVPLRVQQITVSLIFTGGARAKVQTTTSPILTVKEGTPNSLDWPHGVINQNCSDVCVPVTALRLVKTVDSGTVEIEVRAQ